MNTIVTPLENQYQVPGILAHTQRKKTVRGVLEVAWETREVCEYHGEANPGNAYEGGETLHRHHLQTPGRITFSQVHAQEGKKAVRSVLEVVWETHEEYHGVGNPRNNASAGCETLHRHHSQTAGSTICTRYMTYQVKGVKKQWQINVWGSRKYNITYKRERENKVRIGVLGVSWETRIMPRCRKPG